jgi:hypothetical protein
MQTATILALILAALFTLVIVLFQYFYKDKTRGKQLYLLSCLRFISIFGILLLLINPSFKKTSLFTEKQDLILLLDDSYSIQSGGADQKSLDLKNQILSNDKVADRFRISSFGFGKNLKSSDSLSFAEEATDLNNALSAINSGFGKQNSLVLLVSDGNQTLGEAYEFLGSALGFPVYSVVVGDTTSYADLKLSQVNLNKYAFLKNTFPLEFFVVYEGKESINSRISVRMDGKVFYSEAIRLDEEQNSKKISTALLANEVGLKMIEIVLDSIPGERNTYNNKRRLPIEVIDEKTRIGLVSQIVHPDLGALTKAIESNEQRTVTILDPSVSANELSSYDMLILYQPNPSFDATYKFIRQAKLNTFTITGARADWNYLNTVQKGLEFSSFNQTDDILPVINPSFGLFDLAGFSVDEYPPLTGSLGEMIITNPYESILDKQIKGVLLQDPLLAVVEEEKNKHAYLFGENIWTWRVQSFRNNQDFRNFDEFLNKLIFYLTSDGKRDRLTVNYEQIYSGVTEKKIRASFFDATFELDREATLDLNIRGLDKEFVRTQPMFFGDNQYEADLSDLPSGEYTFSLAVEGEEFRQEGRFTVEDFNLEQLFVSSDYVKLGQLSGDSGGKLYFPDQIDALLDEITLDPRFLPTQKSVENVVSLIDFRIILAIIILALTAEWLIRKYNGLI